MAFTLPQVRVGAPQHFEALSVFPLFTSGNGTVEYLLSDEAIDSELLTVEEVSEEGSIPELLVENKGDLRVLFLEGEELIGAKQNRILNTSLLIAAKTKMKVPVSCVEQGRWGYETRKFSSGGRHSPSRLRYALKAGVAKSLAAKRGYCADQGEIWKKVAEYQAAHGVDSPTGAMSDTFEALELRAAEARKSLPYVEEARGIAISLGEKVVAVELFDKPQTCRKVWDRLLSGYILDALEELPDKKRADPAVVEQLLGATKDAKWDQLDPVGEGEEYRSERADEHASALCLNDHLVHGSIVAQ